MISPDPNLKIDELCVPIQMAKIFTYPQRVFAHNLSSLRQLVLSGPDKWPGANHVLQAVGASHQRFSLHFRDRKRAASELKVGDICIRTHTHAHIHMHTYALHTYALHTYTLHTYTRMHT